jgi:hypothetical protein
MFPQAQQLATARILHAAGCTDDTKNRWKHIIFFEISQIQDALLIHSQQAQQLLYSPQPPYAAGCKISTTVELLTLLAQNAYSEIRKK